MDELMAVMVSDKLTMCLDCLEVAALINLYSCLILESDVEFKFESLFEMADTISVEIFSVSFCMIRKPTALIVEAVVSGILLSRDRVKRILAKVVAEKFPLFCFFLSKLLCY